MQLRLALVVMATAGVAACGGGGSSSVVQPGAPPPPAPTYRTVQALRSVDPLTGYVSPYTTDLAASQLTPDPSGASSGRITGSAAGIQKLTINVTGAGGLNFSEEFLAADLATAIPIPGSTSRLLSGSKTALDGSVRSLTILDTASSNLSYVVLGAWGYAATAAAATTADGWFAFGSATRADNVPLTGTATYTGLMVGRYADGTALWSVSASAGASADFANRSVTLSTSGTQITNQTLAQPPQAAAGLNLSGTLNYAAGTNQLTGVIGTVNGFSGPAAARFYGPAAAEIGGTFYVRDGANTGQMAGSFGLKR